MVRGAQFGKKEKLKSRKQIEMLFAEGKSFAIFPLRVTHQFFPAEKGGMLAGVTVSKKHYKRAVDRNRIKRLLREAYRLQKEPLLHLLEERRLSGRVFFTYTGREILPFETLYGAMGQCLVRLARKLPSHEIPS